MQRLLDIENLRTTFDIHVGKVQAVRGIDLHVDEGETVGIVGESGCGKSVSMLSILHLLPDYAKISADKMVFEDTDLTQLTPKMFRKISGDQIGMIFQDPMTSLNPLFTVGDQLIEPLRIHKGMSKQQAREVVLEKLRLVEIPDPESRMKQYPHELSGGMRQRIMIAMAIMCNPRLIIADEPTTALDVTIQAQVLELMHNLKEKLRTSMIMITHDLGIVAEMCDKVAIMYAGRVVEYGTTEALYNRRLHPYTEGLFNSLPDLDSEQEELKVIHGLMPDPTNLPSGCCFHPRCPYAVKSCSKEVPPMIEIEKGHFVACPIRAPKAKFSDVKAEKGGERHD